MNDYKSLLDQAERSDEYWAESAIVEFTEDVQRIMRERGISRAELARRIGTSQAYVTKILRGNANFTLSSMVKLSRALGVHLRLHLAPENSLTHWRDEIISKQIETDAHLQMVAESKTDYPTE